MLIGLLSDAHGCVEAFDTALTLLRSRGAERLYYLGDSVGYIPGTGVLDRLLEESDIVALRGNHDDMLLRGNWPHKREQVYRLAETGTQLTPRQRRYLEGLSPHHRADLPGGPVLLVHGSPAMPLNGYVYPDTPLDGYVPCDCRAVFMGHTHRPFVRTGQGTTFINVGSCSLPRDGGMLGTVVLYDSAASGHVDILRFDAGPAFDAALTRVGTVHPSLTALRHRPMPEQLVGTVINV